MSGSGEIALKINSGGPPRQIATGILLTEPTLASAWSAPCLCICQCRPHSVGPYICERYIPRFCSPLTGSFVTTNGRVMNGPPSSGQVFGIGRVVRSGFSITTCWQAPFFTRFGAIRNPCRARLIPFQGFLEMVATSGFINSTSRFPIVAKSSTPSAVFTRCLVPKRFIASGIAEILPSCNLGCSKITAFPSVFTRRSAMQPASNSTSTGLEMRSTSPCSSRAAINCCRLLHPTALGGALT